MIIFLLLMSVVSAEKICKIDLRETRKYPTLSNFEYGINFNIEKTQPNYAYYLIGSGTGCNGCSQESQCRRSSYIKKDPYGLKNDTDTYTPGYDRGHLVPFAEYGCDTNIISNTAPMEISFNRGVWNQVEANLRILHPGRLVFIGCDYRNDTIFLKGRDVYVATGCYYLVIKTDILPFNEVINLTIVDNGYYQNIKDSEYENKIPPWVFCQEIVVLSEISFLAIGISIFISVVLSSSFILFLYFTRNKIKRGEPHRESQHESIEMENLNESLI